MQPSGHEKGDSWLCCENPKAQLGNDNDEEVDEPQITNILQHSFSEPDDSMCFDVVYPLCVHIPCWSSLCHALHLPQLLSYLLDMIAVTKQLPMERHPGLDICVQDACETHRWRKLKSLPASHLSNNEFDVKGSQGTIRSLQRSWRRKLNVKQDAWWKMLERRWSQWRMDYQQKSESRRSSPSFKFQALIVNTELSSPSWGPSFNLPENQPRSHFWPVVDRLGMLLVARRRKDEQSHESQELDLNGCLSVWAHGRLHNCHDDNLTKTKINSGGFPHFTAISSSSSKDRYDSIMMSYLLRLSFSLSAHSGTS